MQPDLIEYIAHKTPIAFINNLVEKLEEAYFLAHQECSTYAEPERPRILGQARHYRQNGAFRDAATEAGLLAVAPHTDPKGERYSLVASDNIRYGRIAVPFNNKIPRASAHRAAIATVNSRLEPVNLDLFNLSTKKIGDGLGCLIVTVNPPKFEGQSVPRNICVGVPYSNLRGWHLFTPITDVLAAYRPAQEMEVPDLAFAKLKKKMNDAEG